MFFLDAVLNKVNDVWKFSDGAAHNSSIESEYDDQGDVVHPSKYANTFTYSSGLVQTAAFTNGTNTWTKTYTYTGSDVTGISLWARS